MKNLKKSVAVTGGKAGRELATGKDLAVGHLEQATGKSPEPAGSPAGAGCPTSERRKLVGILERFNISVAGFDGLRADCYEKHLAARSLADLERFYEVLLGDVRGYKEMARDCPVWGEDNKAPHFTTLGMIRKRIETERTVNEVEDIMNRARVSGLPVAQQTVVLEGMLGLLNAELWNAKFDGKPILENLPGVDRVIRAVATKARVEQGAERNRLRAEALELRKAIRHDAGANNKKEESVDDDEPWDPVAEMEKVRRMTERIYGKNPNKLKEEAKANVNGANETLDPNQNTNEEGKKEKTEARSQESEAGTNQKTNDECKMTNGASMATEVVETIEEYQRRQREAEEHRRWVERQMRIRDKVNGTEVSFNPYA